jgi:hypothetical protein
MLRSVALERTDISKELSASIIRVTRIGEVGTMLAVTSNRRKLRRNTNLCIFHVLVFLRSVRRLLVTATIVPSSPILVTPMMEGQRSSETPDLSRATRRNIPKADILHSRRHENLTSYIRPPNKLRGP